MPHSHACPNQVTAAAIMVAAEIGGRLCALPIIVKGVVIGAVRVSAAAGAPPLAAPQDEGMHYLQIKYSKLRPIVNLRCYPL